MKKALCVLTLLLLLTSASWAAGAEAGLRNGLKWGMSPEEVISAEGHPEYEMDREKGMDALVISGATHEEAPCSLICLFYKGALSMFRVEYDTSDGTLRFDDIEQRLSARYGEATVLDTALLTNLLLDDEATPDRFVGWMDGSDTLIYITESRSEDSIQIIYSDVHEQ